MKCKISSLDGEPIKRSDQPCGPCQIQSKPEDGLVLGDDAGHQSNNDADRYPDRCGADPRARQGTVEHLSVMPVVPAEIMLAKMFANGLVILVAAMLSLQFVVHLWIGAPIAGSIFLFLLGAALYALVVAALGILLVTLSTTMGQFGLLAMPVLMITQLLSGSSTPMESMPVWLQYVMRTISPTPHFVAFAQAVLFRGADLSLVWRPLLAMLIIGTVYFAFAMRRFRRVIFGS